jgi:phosphopantothenoylcysteine decarboxylase/phosphopantothenate--cysteine ligase
LESRTVFKDRNILLGVTGSIAAYKAVSLLRRLSEAGARVSVVMTESSRRFITPLTFEALCGRRVYTDLFSGEAPMRHLALAEESDLILVAPATANCIGKMANGVADDLLSTVLLATRAPVIVAPAMDGDMWDHPVLQRNISVLEGIGCSVITPERGPLASGKTGVGRLASEAAILSAAEAVLSRMRDLEGETVLVTAGPTREPIDPVRFLSNRSSGKMGFAVARAALDRGARVILVAGPTALVPPAQADLIRVETAGEMRDAVLRMVPESSVVIMAAAVADYRPAEMESRKIKKNDRPRAIELVRTADILREVSEQRRRTGKPAVLVGFSAETGPPVPEGRRKLREKDLDLIVANDVSAAGIGFDSDDNLVYLIDRADRVDSPGKLPKPQVAGILLDRVRSLLMEASSASDRNVRVTGGG